MVMYSRHIPYQRFITCIATLLITLFVVSNLSAENTPLSAENTSTERSVNGEKTASENSTTEKPCVTDDRTPNVVSTSSIERSAGILKKEKMLWADSYLFRDIPLLDKDGKKTEENKETVSEISTQERIKRFIQVEEWYNQAPASLEGKYILVEVWATWCPPCRRTLPMLNAWHQKYGKELVVISICETDRKALDECPGNLKGKDITHYVGIDTQRRTANALNVWGIPHAVLIEPVYGAVVWEGMPNQPGYELTDKIIERILEIGRKLKEKTPE